MARYFHGRVFCSFLAWQLFPMGALSPRRRRCSVALQRDSRVLAAAFFYGLLLWHRGTIRSASSVSFCILFLTSQKKYAAGGTVAVLPRQRKSGEIGQAGGQGTVFLYLCYGHKERKMTVRQSRVRECPKTCIRKENV